MATIYEPNHYYFALDELTNVNGLIKFNISWYNKKIYTDNLIEDKIVFNIKRKNINTAMLEILL